MKITATYLVLGGKLDSHNKLVGEEKVGNKEHCQN